MDIATLRLASCMPLYLFMPLSYISVEFIRSMAFSKAFRKYKNLCESISLPHPTNRSDIDFRLCRPFFGLEKRERKQRAYVHNKDYL